MSTRRAGAARARPAPYADGNQRRRCSGRRHNDLGVDIEQMQAKQPGPHPSVDDEIAFARSRHRKATPAPHACFCRSDDRLELTAVRPATKPATPAILATALRDGRSPRADAAIRSLRVLRRNSINFLRVKMLSGAGPAPSSWVTRPWSYSAASWVTRPSSYSLAALLGGTSAAPKPAYGPTAPLRSDHCHWPPVRMLPRVT
jgi:hypothetical protein